MGAAALAGVMIAVSTYAHSTCEFGFIRYGIDQARRAGLAKSAILSSLHVRAGPLVRLVIR
jgi:histidinol phosphatase-like PHP family hydrolase